MPSNKRRAESEIVVPPRKRLRANASQDVEPPRRSSRKRSAPQNKAAQIDPRHSSTPRNPPRSPHLLRSPTSPSRSAYTSFDVTDDDEESSSLLDRIHSGITYMREQQRKNEATKQSTRIRLSSNSSGPALKLLRRYGTRIYYTKIHETYEIPVPRPDWVKEGDLPGLHDPQWWVDKSAAEVKAGPHAEKHDIKRAEAVLKGAQTRKNKKKGPSAHQKEIERKLQEGLRRQNKNIGMSNQDVLGGENEDESDSEDRSAPDDSGVELDSVQNNSEEEEDDEPVIHQASRQNRKRKPVALEDASDADYIEPGKRQAKKRTKKRVTIMVENVTDTEDEMPVKHQTNQKNRRRRPIVVEDESGTEDDEPVVTRRTRAARRWMSRIVEESEEDSEH